MCGICGVVYAHPQRKVSEETVLRMRDVLTHRGPDDAGVYIDGPVGLGHRRLTVIDLSSRARQPMVSGSGRYWITYNGEIYNYRTLRAQLSARGHKFRSDSDTEVLVEGLDEWGFPQLLQKLDGIFAFAAWDQKERRLLAARDPLGVKPFHYCETVEGIFFASELKALWAAGIPCEIDPEALEELLVFRFVAGQSTGFRGLQRLLPGHWLQYSQGHLTTRSYWKATEHVGNAPQFAEIWKTSFRQAVQDQSVSDVPVGTLLSGGLDSSAVTAELARANNNHSVQTFTISLPPDEGLDEGPFADLVARRWNCQHHQLRVPVSDVLTRLRMAQSYHDEPLAHGNDMYIFELSRMAKKYVTVLLSGEGADETLGGYVRYQPVRYPWALKLGRSFVATPVRAFLGLAQRRHLRTLHRFLTFRDLDETLLYNAADILPRDLRSMGFPTKERFDARRSILEAVKTAAPEPVKQLMLYDIQTFLCSILNRNDRMTMGASIECRVPFLAVAVVEAALKIPTGLAFSGRVGKQVLRDHALKLLPREVIRRPKWGLGIPWARYLRADSECRDFVTKLPQTTLGRQLSVPRLKGLIKIFREGDDRIFPLIYQIFALAVWWEQIVERKGRSSLPPVDALKADGR